MPMIRPAHVLLASALSMTLGSAANAATITVNAGGDLQAALNKAVPGDTILLQAGATFTGNFVLPKKSGSTFIIVRSSAYRLAARRGHAHDVRLCRPVAQDRIGQHQRGAADGDRGPPWQLQFLEFQANSGGYGEIIRLGSSSETMVANQPHHLLLDRLYIHGHSSLAASVASPSTVPTRRSSTRRSATSRGRASTHRRSADGRTGAYLIENNFLEATGENMMFGGADPAIQGLVPANITIRRNLIPKYPAWQKTIFATPSNAKAAPSTGGSLPGSTYTYRIVAYGPCGNGVTCRSSATGNVSATLTSTGSVTITWSAVWAPPRIGSTDERAAG